MFSRLREPFGKAGLIVAIVALVAATVGGAYAANKQRNHKKGQAGLNAKQKKQVKNIAKAQAKTYANSNPGPAGPQGPAGANGADGQNGANGSNGSDGEDGEDGADGKSVLIEEGAFCEGGEGIELEVEESGEPHEVCNGKDGADGKDGMLQPGETLAKGASLVGVWSGVTKELFGATSIPVSFTVPLATAPNKFVVVKSGVDKTAEGCPKPSEWANAQIPEAAEGSLCLYEGVGPGATTGEVLVASVFEPTSTGTRVTVTCKKLVDESCQWQGVWAVTSAG